MKEYIEREAALKAVEAADLCILDEYDMIKQIKDIPAADVREAARGEWIRCGDGENVPYMCSHCGKTSPANLIEKWGADYCTNCGADMREVTDEKQDFNP